MPKTTTEKWEPFLNWSLWWFRLFTFFLDKVAVKIRTAVLAKFV